MCGFAGFFSRKKNTSHARGICQQMIDSLIHRGPDDGGVWVDDHTEITLGHRRLAIQDLSPWGHQPMTSTSGRFTVAFNGEIYNFLTLKHDMEQRGVIFRGGSDTEVLLAAIEYWGLTKSLENFVGMFAFALWDKQDRVLTLARDRLGEKPLYYGWQGQSFLFASELKALRAHHEWLGEINRDSLAIFMRHKYIPAPYSIYHGIHKLLPGTTLSLPVNATPQTIPDPVPYWSAKTAAEYGSENPLLLSDQEAIEELETLLRRTIQEKMIADVPLGAFLSGGIDSSTVVSLMQAESSRPVKTFTIGFQEEGYNEAEQAKLIAQHLGTEHTELYITAKQAMDVIPKLPTLYDEPFSDSSQIPTFLVSEMTKQQVTVALSGDGGDELFCGYNRYQKALSIWNKVEWIPDKSRKSLAFYLETIPIGILKSIFCLIAPISQKYGRPENKHDTVKKFIDVMAMDSPDRIYTHLVSHWKNPTNLVIGSDEPPTVFTDPSRQAKLNTFLSRMMFVDTVSYLPDDILCKVDRASMGVSLEVRVPLIDHRVVEFAWRLPLSMKLRNGRSKWLLRQVLDKYVPSKMMERPKMGFGMPIDAWLRGPLRQWAEELLQEGRLKQEGFLNPLLIQNKWKDHLSGKNNWHHYLWDILMFQSWLEKEKQ